MILRSDKTGQSACRDASKENGHKSLEGQTFATTGTDTVYLSRKQLQKFGTVAARPLGTNFKIAQWDDVLDGLVVFREERAPEVIPF